MADKDVIKAGELRLTKASAIGAALVALAAAIEPVFEAILGGDPEPGHKVAIFVAAIGAWALVASADMISRSHATAHTQPQVAPIQQALTVTYTKGHDETGYAVVAVRTVSEDPAGAQFLIVKAGKPPVWASQDDLRFD